MGVALRTPFRHELSGRRSAHVRRYATTSPSQLPASCECCDRCNPVDRARTDRPELRIRVSAGRGNYGLRRNGVGDLGAQVKTPRRFDHRFVTLLLGADGWRLPGRCGRLQVPQSRCTLMGVRRGNRSRPAHTGDLRTAALRALIFCRSAYRAGPRQNGKWHGSQPRASTAERHRENSRETIESGDSPEIHGDSEWSGERAPLRFLARYRRVRRTKSQGAQSPLLFKF